ncbi:MAG: DUF5684 domain-containing protein [Patescibacteria group bacterium]
MNTATCTVNGQLVQCPEFLSNPLIWIGLLIIPLIIVILTFVSLWKIFEKANKPGWASLIPIYNIVVLCEIVKKPTWYVVLFFIPFVNVILAFILLLELSKAFGKGVGFTLGLIFLPMIFYPVLAFDSSTYKYGNSTAEPEVPTISPATV